MTVQMGTPCPMIPRPWARMGTPWARGTSWARSTDGSSWLWPPRSALVLSGLAPYSLQRARSGAVSVSPGVPMWACPYIEGHRGTPQCMCARGTDGHTLGTGHTEFKIVFFPEQKGYPRPPEWFPPPYDHRP
jgi:hypothetical protein